ENGDADGVIGTLQSIGNTVVQALEEFVDNASALISVAALDYTASIDIGTKAKLISAADIDVSAKSTAEIDLKPLFNIAAAIGVGVLQNHATVTVAGTLHAADSIDIQSHVK